MKKTKSFALVQSSGKPTVSRSSFKWSYGVNDPGEIVVRLVGICLFRSQKRLNEKIESLFPKKEKKRKPRRGGVVTNNVALPEMLLTSSPVQRFHLFFSSRCLIYLPIPHISIHLNSPSFLCHLSSCCCSLLLGNASPHPVPSLIPHLSFVLLSPSLPFFTPLLLLKGRKP